MKRLAFALPFLVLLAGCQGPSFVGSWTADVATEAGNTPCNIEVKPDGTWSGSLKTNGMKLPGFEVPGMGMTASGTWKVEGESLAFATTQAAVIDPPPLIKQFPGFVEDKIKANLNKWGSAKIKFPDAKSAELTLQTGDKVVLTRVTK